MTYRPTRYFKHAHTRFFFTFIYYYYVTSKWIQVKIFNKTEYRIRIRLQTIDYRLDVAIKYVLSDEHRHKYHKTHRIKLN